MNNLTLEFISNFLIINGWTQKKSSLSGIARHWAHADYPDDCISLPGNTNTEDVEHQLLLTKANETLNRLYSHERLHNSLVR